MPDPIAPLRALVAALLAAVHDLLVGLGLPGAAGTTWVLAVVALVALVRLLLLPLAVHQVRGALRMRALAPDLRRLQDRYRGRTDAAARDALARETMALYRERGVRPLGSLLPALLQVPVFLALLQVLEHAARGTGDAALASFAVAAVLGAPLAATALSGGWPGVLVGVGLLAVTASAQMLTQHLAAPAASPVGAVLLVLPLLTATAGLLLPIGVTAYWCASALWTLGQQAVLLRVVRV